MTLEASVVVTARDAEATLERALGCLAAQETPFAYEVVLVDNGSRDRTRAIAEATGRPVRVVRGAGGDPGAARDEGVAQARGRLLAFTDADCYAAPGWLAAGVGALAHADLVQGRVLPDPGVPMGPFDRSLWVTRAAGLWETANLFVTRELFEAAGGFHDWVATGADRPFGEDAWLGWRVKRLGARSAFCEAALVHHEVFRRDAREYVAEHARRCYFPALVRRIPELRATFLHQRLFLDARTAAFDAALAGTLAALATRRGWPALLALPYLRRLVERPRCYLSQAAVVTAADVAADVVTAWALARGSIAARAPVL